MKLSKALGKVLLLAFMVGMVSCQKDTLSVSPMGGIVFSSETESQRIKIKCNGDWYVIVDGAWGAWLELDKKDGSGDAI